ncbi:MAG: hypothetical protein NC432_13105 [Roseburia sp.]|nr:hypothetical protein [Roseburia sp.]
MYYATDTVNVFCVEQYERDDIDYDKKMVSFRLDASLEGHITGLRLDFPNQEQLLSIGNITISSGGIIRRQYNPCVFFAEENIADTHNITALDRAPARESVYIVTSPNESYVVLTEQFCRQITKYYSHFLITKLAICAFFCGAFYLGRKKLFSAASFPEKNLDSTAAVSSAV